MTVKLLTEHHLEFLSLKGGCRGSSESTLVKISNCWKSHAAAHLYFSADQPYMYKDAIFLSPHKFVGGVQTPGMAIFLCKNHLTLILPI